MRPHSVICYMLPIVEAGERAKGCIQLRQRWQIVQPLVGGGFGPVAKDDGSADGKGCNVGQLLPWPSALVKLRSN